MDPASLMVRMSHQAATAFCQEGREGERGADDLTTSLSHHSSLSLSLFLSLSLSLSLSVDWDSHVIKKAAGAEGVT